MDLKEHINMTKKITFTPENPEGVIENMTPEEITQALERLAMLRGESARENVLDRLFSKFCIGK